MDDIKLKNKIKMNKKNNQVSIIIPAFNEEEGIEKVLNQLKSLNLGKKSEIIVIDDGSTDQTFKIASAKGTKIIRHEKNMGYGAALKTGIRHSKNEIIVITDADGSYPINNIPTLLENMENSDMVVGARIGKKVHIPIFRKPAKWFINKLANQLSGIKIPDLNSGLRAMRKERVERFFSILPDSFSFTSTITLAFLTNGYSVKYIPIEYYKRKGKSKIHPIKDTLNFIQLVIRTIMYFDPLKVFLPLSFIFFGASVAVLIVSWLSGRFMDVTTVILFVTGIQLLAIGMIADLIDKRGRL
jgi:glycosyltransferase involved in cell wall biosynthesis